MRTTSIKTIYMTIPELKEAITRYVRDKQGKIGVEDLYAHLMGNEWCMDWTSKGEELAISIDGEIKDKQLYGREVMEKRYIVKIEHLDDGIAKMDGEADCYSDDLCIKLPDELMKQLGWELGDEIEWEETEICSDQGEQDGFTLSNLTKNPKVEPSEWAKKCERQRKGRKPIFTSD